MQYFDTVPFIAGLSEVQYRFFCKVSTNLIVYDNLLNLGEKTEQLFDTKVRGGRWRFFKATSKDSLQGSGKTPDFREALMTCAIYEARKGRVLVIINCGMPSLPLACVEK